MDVCEGNLIVRLRTRTVITNRLSKLAQTRTIWVFLLTILVVISITIPNSVRAQDERVTVRLDGRALFRVSAVDNTKASD